MTTGRTIPEVSQCGHDVAYGEEPRICADCGNATFPYRVDYFTGDGTYQKTVMVDAIDAIDAKHLAEAAEGAVITIAYARKVG